MFSTHQDSMVGKAENVESARDEAVSVSFPLEVQLQLHGLSTANQGAAVLQSYVD